MMRTLFYLALLLSLTSFTGCVDMMKEKAKENAARRSKFHFAPVDHRKEGVNTEHLFCFTETSMQYNGKPFSIHIPMDSIFNIFGPYSRVTCGEGQSSEYKSYIWDIVLFLKQTIAHGDGDPIPCDERRKKQDNRKPGIKFTIAAAFAFQG